MNVDNKKNSKSFHSGWTEVATLNSAAPVRPLEEQAPDLLVSIVESLNYPTDYRLAAAEALAKQGDPRIRTTEPSMIDIPAAQVKTGLPENKVDTVCERSRSFGVMRDVLELDSPEHLVQLSPFRIGKYCVTNVEFLDFEKATGFHFTPTSWSAQRYDELKPNHPVFP